MRALKITRSGVQEIHLADSERETITNELSCQSYQAFGQPAPGHLCLGSRRTTDALDQGAIQVKCNWLPNETLGDMLVVGIRGEEFTDATLGASRLSDMLTIDPAIN